MDANGESDLLKRIRDGDDEAVAALWDQVQQRLRRVSRKRFKRDGFVDSEDIAQSAFRSFVSRIRAPDEEPVDSIWGMLTEIAYRKASKQRKRRERKKRGEGQAAMQLSEEVAGKALLPEQIVILAEETQLLLDFLGDEKQCRILRRRLEGYNNVEISQEIGMSAAAVGRRVRQIESFLSERWQKDDDV